MPTSRARWSEPFLEPVMRVGLVVERRHLAIAGAAIERLRLDEAAVGLEPEHLDPELARLGFERREQARADAEPARLGSDPHALHFADAPLRVEAGVEAAAELAEILRDAPARVGAVGGLGGDAHRRGAHQPLDLAHRRDEAVLLRGAEW